MTIEYNSNNSGGDWWLTDDDWRKLESAGWSVQWHKDDPDWTARLDEEGRWLGALAGTAFSPAHMSMAEAINNWADLTGQDPDAEGCSCCGRPHYFYEARNATP